MLKIGDRSEAVRVLQHQLTALGYDVGGADGIFGGKTERAVKTFQAARTLPKTGEWKLLEEQVLASILTNQEPDHARLRPRWLAISDELGPVEEAPGGRDNPFIIGWARELAAAGYKGMRGYTHDSIAWCALYAGYCIHKAGYRIADTLGALNQGRFAMRIAGPALGAIAFMPRGEPGQGHIGFVVGRTSDGRIVLRGGNQGDRVCDMPVAQTRILSGGGYAWPQGATEPSQSAIGFYKLPIVEPAVRGPLTEA